MSTQEKKIKDPHASREAEKYEKPIPSRECILSLFEDSSQTLNYSTVLKLLDLSGDDAHEALKRRMTAMVRDGQLLLKGRNYLRPFTSGCQVSQVMEQVLTQYNFKEEWSKKVLAEVDKLPDEPRASDFADREDLRDLSFVTIDGEDAKDFDDAVYVEKTKTGGFRLFVAIADVSHYVTPDSALDQQAALRGNSVYFPRLVIPMLPEKLSNGLCSLKPKVNRLCMVAEMDLDAAGVVLRKRFYEGVICSKARLTYTQVANWLKQPPSLEELPVFGMLQDLHALFNILLKGRGERGALEIDTIETRIQFDAEGQVSEIVPVHRNDAHRLIEECMLLANVAAAEVLEKAEGLGMYRVHQDPDPGKILDLRQFLSLRGIRITGGVKPSTADINRVLEEAKTHADANLIQIMVLRSLPQAIYSPENIGHFGLAYPAYTHFTSPIRRYADLWVHRQIKAILKNKPHKRGLDKLKELSEHISQTERTADEASRQVTNRLKCIYLSKHLGTEFEVVISGVTRFGFFASIPEWMIDGLIHVKNLRDDHYEFDEKTQILRGMRGGKVYQIGDRLTIKVARVNVEMGQIDFELLGEAPGSRPPRRRR